MTVMNNFNLITSGRAVWSVAFDMSCMTFNMIWHMCGLCVRVTFGQRVADMIKSTT